MIDVERATPSRVSDESRPVVVEDLVKRYPKRPTNAVDGVTFSVAQSEVFGLLGPRTSWNATAELPLAATRRDRLRVQLDLRRLAEHLHALADRRHRSAHVLGRTRPLGGPHVDAAVGIDGDEGAVGTADDDVNAVALFDRQSNLNGVSDELELGIHPRSSVGR
jgi:hypothetical protein